MSVGIILFILLIIALVVVISAFLGEKLGSKKIVYSIVISLIMLLVGFVWGSINSASNTKINCYQSPQKLNFSGVGDNEPFYEIYNQCELDFPLVFWEKHPIYNKTIKLFLKENIKGTSQKIYQELLVNPEGLL